MKNPIAKLAVAAAVIAAVVLGVFEFVGIDGGGTSGVAWAEVAQKVQASRGVIYRQQATCTKYEYPNGPGYSIIYISPAQSRSDAYNGGQLNSSMYCDTVARTRVVVLHGRKGYVRETLPDRDSQQHPGWDPKNWVQKFLSCEYRKLGEKTINGVLCEGTETTDPTLVGEGASYFQIDSLIARLWVSVETGYPVLVESEFTGQYSGEMVIDQIQWDVELEASVFEPNIPPDYEQM